MTTSLRVKAARELHRLLSDEPASGRSGTADSALHTLRQMVPFDCANILRWDPTTGGHRRLAVLDFPVEGLLWQESHEHREPLFSAMRRGGSALLLREIPRELRRGAWLDTVVRPHGFTDGLTLRVWASDGRFLGTLNANMVGGAQPDDLALDLLELVTPSLATLLDPVPRLWPRTGDLADGRADGLVVTGAGRVRRLTAGADADLARRDGPLWPVIRSVLDGRAVSGSAVVLVGSDVVAVAVHGGDHGALVVHRTVPAPFGLSVRELQVLDALTEGLTNGDLAQRFGIAHRTVATYIERILAKTGCPNRIAATRLAVRLNLTV